MVGVYPGIFKGRGGGGGGGVCYWLVLHNFRPRPLGTIVFHLITLKLPMPPPPNTEGVKDTLWVALSAPGTLGLCVFHNIFAVYACKLT